MDRRFLIKLFAIEAVFLIVLVLASIQFKEARQPEQYLGRSGDFQIKEAPTTASGIAGASSNGAQSQLEERLALEAENKRQEEAAAKKEPERLALEAEKKRQEEAAKKEAETLALEAENTAPASSGRADKRRQRLALEAERKRQEEAAKKDAERLALALDSSFASHSAACNARGGATTADALTGASIMIAAVTGISSRKVRH